MWVIKLAQSSELIGGLLESRVSLHDCPLFPHFILSLEEKEEDSVLPQAL